MKRIIIVAIALLYAIVAHAQTAGTVSFTVKTVTAAGEFAPKNVVAIWVTNASGTFQKSLKVMAATRKPYLYQWKAASLQNITGAITGATLSSHQTHTVSWNCQTAGGTVVADGDYKIWVEFTEKNGQGPYTSYLFSKGLIADTLTFSNAANFNNIQIIYTPAPSAIEEVVYEAQIFRNAGPDNIGFGVPSQLAENAEFQIFDISGKLLYESFDYFDDGSVRYFLWNAAAQRSGIYVYRIESGAQIFCGKFFK